METKSIPPAVVISMIVLGLTTFVGVISVSAALGSWQVDHAGLIPFRLIGRAVIFGVVPVVAIRDILRAHSSGRYLAILSLLCVWAVFLRVYTDILLRSTSVLRRVDPVSILLLFGIILALPVLILALGFNKKVAAYFGTDRLV